MTLAMSVNAGLLVIWIAFAAIALAGVSAVLVWAVRARQFSAQDAARYLPLKSGIPDGPGGPATPAKGGKGGGHVS
jgi:hypothetical protein